MDSDFHTIENGAGERLNPDREIVFGNHVWIGCRCTILKGVHIADGAVVAAGTLLSQSVGASGAIVGGNPARVLKTDIIWKL